MRKLFFQPFMPDSIHRKVDRFFELYKLSLAFALFSCPWLLVNLFVKFSLPTSWLYALVALTLFPNAIATLRGITRVYQGEHHTLKESLVNIWQTWRQQDRSRWGLHMVVVLIVVLFCGEFTLVMHQAALRFMIVPFLIVGAFLLAAVWHYLLIAAVDTEHKAPQQMLQAIYLSWRNLFLAVILGLGVALWLSVGYQAPSLNVLAVNVIIFWIGYKLCYKSVGRVVTAVDEEVN